MKNRFYCLLVMLCLALSGMANASPAIRPVTINDSVPAGVYELLEKQLGIPVKGKALLLDFWETSCGNCLAALPFLDSLQRQFAASVQVITITSKGSKERVAAILKKYPRTRNVQLPVITGDSLLRQYFPFTLFSHLVWISADGVVKAITSASSLSEGNMATLVSGERLSLPLKKDLLEFDYQAPMLGFTPESGVTASPLYYDAISGHLNGVDATSTVVHDSATCSSRYAFFNMNLVQLCRLSLENGSAGIPAKQLVLQVPDESRYRLPAKNALAAWKEQNTFCYFLQAPFTSNRELQKQQIRKGLSHQLETVFGIHLQKEEKLLPCLVLKLAPKTDTLPFTTGKSIFYHNLSELVNALNENTALPWLYDETGIHGLKEMTLSIPENFGNSIENLDLALRAYGFMLTREERLQVLYILTDERTTIH